jgi:ABC-type transport system involved in cytochrome c biogenesis permease component
MHALRKTELAFLVLAVLGAVLAAVLVKDERILAAVSVFWWLVCVSFAVGITKGYVRGARSLGNLLALALFLLGAVVLTIGLVLALRGVI